jgi:hypothetical protein
MDRAWHHSRDDDAEEAGLAVLSALTPVTAVTSLLLAAGECETPR